MSERQKDLLGIVLIGGFTLACCVAIPVLILVGMDGFVPLWVLFVILGAWNLGQWIGFYRSDRDR